MTPAQIYAVPVCRGCAFYYIFSPKVAIPLTANGAAYHIHHNAVPAAPEGPGTLLPGVNTALAHTIALKCGPNIHTLVLQYP